MSLLTRFFQRDPPEAKALTITRDPWDGFVPIGAAQRQTTDTATLQDTMSESELVFACLKLLTDAASDPRLIVQTRKSKRDGTGQHEYVEQPDHPLRRLIARPNPYMSESDLMKAMVVSWATSRPRRAYIEKEFKRGLLVGLWPLDPACMSARYRQTDNGRVLIGWRWSRDGRFVDYGLDDLIIRDGPAWFNPSPSAAVAGSVRADQAQTDYIGSFFETGGMPSVYLRDEERYLSPEMREQARQRWAATYSNRTGGAHSLAVLDKSQTIGKIGASLDELDSETLRMVSESRICMVYGVPPLLVYAYVGLMRATYSNLKEAREGFWDLTVSPLLKEWREFWTRTLLPEFEEQSDIDSGKVKLAYDMSTVAAMQDDVDALHERAIKGYTSGLFNLNEARAILNKPPVDGDQGGQFKSAGDIRGGNGEQIFGYHITEGIVDINEARVRLGLEPRDDDGSGQRLRALQSQLSVVKAAVDTGIPLLAAMRIASVDEAVINEVVRERDEAPAAPKPEEGEDATRDDNKPA